MTDFRHSDAFWEALSQIEDERESLTLLTTIRAQLVGMRAVIADMIQRGKMGEETEDDEITEDLVSHIAAAFSCVEAAIKRHER